MAVLRPMPSTAALLYESSTPWGHRGEIATAFVRPGPPARYHPPVAGRLVVLHPFEPPPTPYAAGHRGVDLAVTSGQVVFAARGGRVLFAGTVAGRGVVVISHSDGISTEYEPVVRAVHVGDIVQTGQVIGRIVGTHHDCHPGGCLHWGARRGGAIPGPDAVAEPPWTRAVTAVDGMSISAWASRCLPPGGWAAEPWRDRKPDCVSPSGSADAGNDDASHRP